MSARFGLNESMAQRRVSFRFTLSRFHTGLCGGVIFNLNHTLRTFKYTFNFRRTMFGCILSIPKHCQPAQKGILDYSNQLRLEIANASNSTTSLSIITAHCFFHLRQRQKRVCNESVKDVDTHPCLLVFHLLHMR